MSTSSATYLKLAAHYRDCLKKYGDKARGMDWPRHKDNLLRFAVMTDLFAQDMRGRRVKVLDFGCGTSHFYQYLQARGLSSKVEYTGIDIGAESIEISKRKFPRNRYLCLDVLATNRSIGVYDYIVINGLFTQKRTMSEREMRAFLTRILTRLQPCYRKGLAFNTMSDQVDFKRPGSFHFGLTQAAALFTKNFTRHFVVRHDYGLYENTFYLFKKETHK